MVFCFWHLKKRRLYVFNLCYLLVINVYCFFDLLLFQWSWYMVNAPGIFLMIYSSVCDFWEVVFMFFVVPVSYTRKFRKKTHTLPCFSLKNHGQSFFLNHLFLQFNSRINRGFCFCKWSPCEDICGILLCKNEFYKNIYLPKYNIL